MKKSRTFKKILFDKILRQRNELVKLAESGLATKSRDAKERGPKPVRPFVIRIEGMEGVAMQVPSTIKAGFEDVAMAISAAEQTRACCASVSANSSFLKGEFEKSFDDCLRAQQSLGAALALSQLGKINSAIAQAKAHLSHRKTTLLRSQVINCWRKDVSSKLSAQKAADELLGRFRWKDGTDVAHRTLAKWIAEAKKRNSSLK